MISCAEAVEQLWAYLDGALSDREKAALEEHLAFCRVCWGCDETMTLNDDGSARPLVSTTNCTIA